MPFKQFR